MLFKRNTTHWFALFIALLLHQTVLAQSVSKQVSATGSLFKEGKDFIHHPIKYQLNTFVSRTGAFQATIEQNQQGVSAVLKTKDGKKVSSIKVNEVAQPDPSLAAYITGGNYLVVREGEIIFSIFSPSGKLLNSVNTYTGLSGKVGSALLIETGPTSVLVANPEIKSSLGSSSRVMYISLSENLHREVQFLDGYTIAEMKSDAQQSRFWIVANKVGKNEAKVIFMDAFGNKLSEFNTDFSLTGANLDAKGETLTVYSETRVSVHNLKSGTRIGGTSLRGGEQMTYATYIPADDQIVMMLYSDKIGTKINGVKFKAISIGQRKIANDSGAAIVVTQVPNLPFDLIRTAANSYQLVGVESPVLVKTSF